MYKPRMGRQCRGCIYLYNKEYCLLKEEYIEDSCYMQCIEKVCEEEEGVEER